MAGAGYTVQASQLASGSEQVSGLVGECMQIARNVAQAASQLASSAGDPEVEAAAHALAASALRQYMGASSALRHTAEQLSGNARAYSQAESDAASAVSAIGSGG